MLGHYLRYMLYSKPHIFIGGLMMRKVDLRMNELKKYEIIKNLLKRMATRNALPLNLAVLFELLTDLYSNIKKMVKLLLFTVIAVDVLLPLSLLM